MEGVWSSPETTCHAPPAIGSLKWTQRRRDRVRRSSAGHPAPEADLNSSADLERAGPSGLARTRDTTLSDGAAAGPCGAPARAGNGGPRTVVAESWRRSLRARVDPDRAEPPAAFDTTDTRDMREAHPLGPLLPALGEQLEPVLSTAPYVAIVTDEHGRVLWRDGSARARVSADTIRLTEGMRWSEDAIGTNGIGTCLATGRPTSIFAAEHLVRMLHPWSCAGAPIRDPDTGRMLGCLDISGPLRALHPASVSLMAVTARLLEEHLRARMTERDERLLVRHSSSLAAAGDRVALLAPSGRIVTAQPAGWLTGTVDVSRGYGDVLLADGDVAFLEPLGEGYLLRAPDGPRTTPVPTLTLACLGRTAPIVRIDGREVTLSQRRAEILTLLALHPAGLTAEQMTRGLYGETASPVTVRAEMHRLRAQLGTGVITRRPYQLAATVDADFLTVRRLLRAGDAPAAITAYRGPLLPGSRSPAIREARRDLEKTLHAHPGYSAHTG